MTPASDSFASSVGRLRMHALLFLMAMLAASANAQDNANDWLERMTNAAQQLNYDGTFVFRNGTRMESMRIIHRADDSGERSRLIALSGVKREVLRDRLQVVCILPDSDAVVVSKTRPPSPYHAAILNATEGFSNYYDFSVADGERVAGRQTEALTLSPKDDHRYGYRLWVDRETGLLLKSDLISGQGDPMEQFIYTSIALPEAISDEMLEPGITGQQMTWVIDDAMPKDTQADSNDESSAWQVEWLPTGFMMADDHESPATEDRMPVTQMVYTDGLASLSVFVEKLETREPMEGSSAMGAMNAFGRVVDGHQITVVGEVPASTVQAVALSVAKR